MRAFFIILMVLLTSFIGCTSIRQNDGIYSPLPATLDEATTMLIANMSENDKKLLRETPASDLISFHMGWGMWIRNSFGLWGGNDALLASCGKSHPDDASSVIIKNVWESLRSDYRSVPAHDSPIYMALQDARIEQVSIKSNSIPEVVIYLNSALPRNGVLSTVRIELSPSLAEINNSHTLSMSLTNIPFLDLLEAFTEITETTWSLKDDIIEIW